MKVIILTVVCFAVIANCHPFLGLDALDGLAEAGTDIGSKVGSALGQGASLGLQTAAGLGAGAAALGAGAVEVGAGAIGAGARAVEEGANLANNVAANFGQRALDLFGLGSRKSARNSNRAASSGANQYSSGASGAQNEGFHRTGAKEFHDQGKHHSSVSKVEKAENSDEHDVGGSQAYDEGAQKSGGFNKHSNGASKYANDVANAAEQQAMQTRI